MNRAARGGEEPQRGRAFLLSPRLNRDLLCPYVPFIHPSRPTLTQVSPEIGDQETHDSMARGLPYAGPWFNFSLPMIPDVCFLLSCVQVTSVQTPLQYQPL